MYAPVYIVFPLIDDKLHEGINFVHCCYVSRA